MSEKPDKDAIIAALIKLAADGAHVAENAIANRDCIDVNDLAEYVEEANEFLASIGRPRAEGRHD